MTYPKKGALISSHERESRKLIYVWFALQTVVRDLISRYWARRRLQKSAPNDVNADQMSAMETIREEVKDMLSEIRNILKTTKQNRNRERIPKTKEIVSEANVDCVHFPVHYDRKASKSPVKKFNQRTFVRWFVWFLTNFIPDWRIIEGQWTF